jgi:hypothetical protein
MGDFLQNSNLDVFIDQFCEMFYIPKSTELIQIVLKHLRFHTVEVKQLVAGNMYNTVEVHLHL